MVNRYFGSGGERAAKVQELFAAIAPRYDLINDVQSFGLHRRWKRRVVELASVRAGDRALDVCCGTGDIARELARRGALVVGLDFSGDMLGVANQRLSELVRGDGPASSSKGGAGPGYVQGDALHLPFGDATFDIVTIGYGLRNLADWEAGLHEMGRVARSGARLIVLDFGKPDRGLWRAVYFGYLKLCVPLFGLLFCGNARAYAYILESLKNYPAQQGVAAKMQELGWVEVRVVNLLGGAMSINVGLRP